MAIQQLQDVHSWWTIALLAFLTAAAVLAAAEVFLELTEKDQAAGRLNGFIVGTCFVMAIAGLGSLLFVHPPDPPVTLVLSTFGDPFGPDLASRYEASHPGITLEIRPHGFGGYAKSIHNELANANPEADVMVLQQSYFALYGTSANDFADLNDPAITSRWTAPALANLSTKDGKELLALPLDVGGMGICYRKDLFRRAGLPTDPESVRDEFTSWQSYLALGRRFHAARPTVAWVDSGAHLMNGILGTSTTPLEAPDGQLSPGGLATVRDAWTVTTAAVRSLGSARANTDPAMEIAIRKSRFATTPCPSWAVGRIERLTTSSAQWGFVNPPGGRGNWGGTFVAVPKDREHVAEAKRLAAWLTAPEQQVITYNQLHIYPALKNTPTDILAAPSAVFRENAVGAAVGTVGTIIHASLQGTSRFPDADLNEVIANACVPALGRVERGASPDSQWPSAYRAFTSALSG